MSRNIGVNYSTIIGNQCILKQQALLKLTESMILALLGHFLDIQSEQCYGSI